MNLSTAGGRRRFNLHLRTSGWRAFPLNVGAAMSDGFEIGGGDVAIGATRSRLQASGLEVAPGIAAAILDILNFPVLLVDRRAYIIDSNAAAEMLLSRRDTLIIGNGRLVPADKRDTPALCALVADATRDPATAPRRRAAAFCMISSGTSRRVPVIAYARLRGEIDGTDGRSATAILTIPNIYGGDTSAAASVLSRMFGLSPAERRIANLVATGLAPAQIAQAAGLSMPTVRTHLGKIYQKTEAGSYSRLMSLLVSLGQFDFAAQTPILV